jgi:uncharacterized protein with HEPN domain
MATRDARGWARLALTHLVQIIGEAGGRIAREFRERYPEVPWTEVIGMRHMVVHDYLGVDKNIVWKVVTGDLPPLIQTLEALMLRDLNFVDREAAES